MLADAMFVGDVITTFAFELGTACAKPDGRAALLINLVKRYLDPLARLATI